MRLFLGEKIGDAGTSTSSASVWREEGCDIQGISLAAGAGNLMTSQYMNLEQAAFHLNETEQELRQWIADGTGPHSFMRGGKRLYHLEDLRQFAESQENMNRHYMLLSVG